MENIVLSPKTILTPYKVFLKNIQFQESSKLFSQKLFLHDIKIILYTNYSVF